jgi:hypothetical protein
MYPVFGIQGLVAVGYSTTPNPFDIAFQKGMISTSVFALELHNFTSESYFYYNNGIPENIKSSTYWVDHYTIPNGIWWQV